jgi:hypothetical protein
MKSGRFKTVHYIGFRGDEYVRANRIFGGPAMIHRVHDIRAQSEIHETDDLVIFAGNEREDRVRDFIGTDVTGPGWDR